MRIPVISRTFHIMRVVVMVVDTETEEVENRTVTLPRIAKNENAILKKVKEMIETSKFKVVTVVSTEISEKRYSMLEEKFIELATPVLVEKSKSEEK